MKLTNEEIIAALKEMTVLELNELVKAVEAEFGVTAAVAAAAPAAQAMLRPKPPPRKRKQLRPRDLLRSPSSSKVLALAPRLPSSKPFRPLPVSA